MSAQIVPHHFLLNEWAQEATAGAKKVHSGAHGDHHLYRYVLSDRTYQEAVQSVEKANVHLALKDENENGKWILESLWPGKPIPPLTRAPQMATN